jgi:L-alanine-DL-glutamate epimerase-like enolase superfamily enzyme
MGAHGSRFALTHVVESLRLATPFRISGYTFSEGSVALVTLAADGHVGRGEANGVYYFNDDPVAFCATIEAHREAIERGITRAELATLLPPGGARNALDCALWDLESKRTGRPVWALAGLAEARPLLTTFTLAADDPATVRAGALKFATARALKLKLDGNLDEDIERVRAVRDARPDVWLGVDANQGHTLETLDALLPTLCDANVRLVEQPLARGREADLDGFDCPIPLAADESVQHSGEIESLVGRFDVINIKLDKCGGLTEALRMVEEARRVGLRTMVGSMFGTSLAAAAGFVVGQLCEVVDLDGPIILAEDRKPSVRYHDGCVSCPDGLWGSYASH